MHLSRASLLLVSLFPLALPAQVELIAGWNFGQFISAGVPSTDGTTGEPVGFIPSNYSGTSRPVDADSGPAHIGAGDASTYSSGGGVLSFGDWDFANATDVKVVELGSFSAINETLVTGQTLFPGDPNNAHLQFTAAAVTDFTITVNTAGFADFDPVEHAQPNASNMTLAIYKASGASASIEWFHNGTPFAVSSTSSGGFVAMAIDLPSSFYGQAAAVITGRVTGDIVIDHVQINGVRATAVTFTRQPAGLVVTSGANASFSVEVSGAASPVYRWRFNGEDLSDGPGVSGAATATLSLSGVTSVRAGVYTVVVDNNGARAESDPAVLTVNVAPAIGQAPSSASANPGGSIVFEVAASGSPAPTYRWRFNGADLDDDARISGANTDTLTITGLTLADAGGYTVVVTNAAGFAESQAAVLTITELTVAPTIQQQPASATVNVGQEAVFRVNASGAPAPAFQWLFNGEPLSNGPGVTGATTATLRVTPSSLAAAGEYRVRVGNSAGSEESDPAMLSVQVAPAIPAGSGPFGQTAAVGGSVTFTVTATGTPALTYQWRKNGEPIEGQTGASLTLDPVSAGSAGDYTVVVTNSVGSVESGVATLVVIQPPLITTEPVSVVVASGGVATFSVVATGDPEPSYQWRKGGEDIPGKTAPTLTLEAVEAADAGEYTVVVTNVAGSDTSEPARLDVAVRVVKATGTRVFAPGTRIVLDSNFAADAGYGFQWLRNGKPIAGATGSTLLIESALAANSGSYAVRIYAAGGRLLTTQAIGALKISVAGIYDALVRDPVSSEPFARVQVTVTDKAGFTGTLIHEDGKTYALKGVFVLEENGYAGVATGVVKRKTPLASPGYTLALDAREQSLAFTLRDGETTFGSAEGEPRVGGPVVVPWSGVYSLALAPLPTELENQPTATAVLKSVVAAKGGAMKLTGVLADGAKVTASVPSSVSGDYAIWVSLYSAKGRFVGDLRLEEVTAGVYTADRGSGGEFFWFRPANPKSKVYPGGIDLLLAPSLARP